MSLFRKKPLSQLINETTDGDTGLKRTLGAGSLIALGIGAIIGAGLFVRTAAAAGGHAGPAIIISFVIAAIGCALAGLCYAEFASLIPIAGSAYTYSYATMGELVAWIIGWDLILEYALGAATVAISWSQYINNLLQQSIGWQIPYEWCHSPLQTAHEVSGVVEGTRGIINVPAVFILVLLTALLVKGTKGSAMINNLIVVVKITIVIMFIVLGWKFINQANYHPFMIPTNAGVVKASDGTIHNYADTLNHGWLGVLKGAGIVFFAFIGFDAVSTAAQEAKNPKKHMPIGILVSLAICTVLYILFSHVLTGIAPYQDFLKAGSEASVVYAINHYMPGYNWLSLFITISILAGFSSVIIVMLLGQTRVFYTMSGDGLVPKVFSDLHPKNRTPFKSHWLFFVFVSLFAAFIPESVVGNMVAIGTLFAFVLVCIGVLIIRKKDEHQAPFRTPAVKIVAPSGALICLAMIAGLGWENWLRLGIWLVIGFVIYFGYSKKHSKLKDPGN